METIDYIFILCGILGVFAILVSVIHPLIPKDLMMESKEINIKRGKIIGSIIGTIIFDTTYRNFRLYYFYGLTSRKKYAHSKSKTSALLPMGCLID